MREVREKGTYRVIRDGNPQANGSGTSHGIMVEVLAKKTIDISIRENCKGIILSGGVAANTKLRDVLKDSSPLPVFIPPKILCTDNGAMIASCTFFKIRDKVSKSLFLEPVPSKSW